MAHISDVTDALIVLIADAIYPNGINNPSIVSVDVSVYVGWPNPQTLDNDMANGKTAHISVYPRPEEHSDDRGLDSEWQYGIGADTGTSIEALRYQQKLLQISIWSPTYQVRDEIAKVVDKFLAGLKRFPLVDETFARISYKSSHGDDHLQKARIYRHDLFYNVEYAVTDSTTNYKIKETTLNVTVE